MKLIYITTVVLIFTFAIIRHF